MKNTKVLFDDDYKPSKYFDRFIGFLLGICATTTLLLMVLLTT